MTQHGSSVKTLVITDLTEKSSALTERLGAAQAATLLADVDRIARDLIHAHSGQEIDKTDGFLVLFDRPTDAVLFALGFHRALTTLSDTYKTRLQARAGIHVGEVFLQENSAEDIARGAKALEVEGLAKPIAARLMATARGGQTLLTQSACDLAKRVLDGESKTGVKGETALNLVWLKHGNYRLQGVTDVVEVFEVGERGVAPLRAPERSAKVRRVYIGRTKAIALGALATVITGFVMYLGLAPEETFAFARRDWVVIGEFENHTQNPLLDDSLETAFRVALEQSQFASIVPHSSVRDALKRMQRDPNAPLNKDVALEVTLREEAKALISASISEVGNAYAISAEIINPQNGRTVMVASANADSPSDILDALDDVSQKVRGRLGESLATIKESSQPLAKVTTANLEALKAFTLSQQSLWSGSAETGMELLELAIERDPGFAMAHGKLASIYASTLTNLQKAQHHWKLALENKDRLSDRERIYVEASSARLKKPADMLRGWKLMSTLYPDQQVGHHNLAAVYWRHYNNYAEAEKSSTAASKIRYPWPHLSYSFLGAAKMTTNHFDDALRYYRQVEALTGNSFDFKTIRVLVAAQRYDEADKEILLVDKAPLGFYKQRGLAMTVDAYADRGMFNKAEETNKKLIKAIPKIDDSPTLKYMTDSTQIALAERTYEKAQLDKLIQKVLNREQSKASQIPLALSSAEIQSVITARIAARNGLLTSAQKISAVVGPTLKSSGFPIWHASAILLEAEIALQQGKAKRAIKLASESLAISELYQGHETLARAYIAAGELPNGEKELLWLIEQRGRIFVENSDSICGCANLFNILDWNAAHLRLARLKHSTGDTTAAVKYYKAFIKHWQAGADQSLEVKAAISELDALSIKPPSKSAPIKPSASVI